MLRRFMEGCDKTGVIVPNDSVEFREQNVTDSSFNDYYHTPSRWPNKNLLEVMAMARLHGLPTRLLDWSTHPYVAAYFAASEALHTGWRRGQRVAIIELNRGPRTNAYCGQIRILKVRGAISMNLVAQHGLFTVHPLVGHRGNPLEIQSLEQYLPSIPQVSIRRLILPIEQSVRLYELCTEFKFDAAQIYPGADGVSRSVLEAYQICCQVQATTLLTWAKLPPSACAQVQSGRSGLTMSQPCVQPSNKATTSRRGGRVHTCWWW